MAELKALADRFAGYNITVSGPVQTETTLLLITSTLPATTSYIVSTSVQPASTSYIVSSLPASTEYRTFTTVSDRYVTETSIRRASTVVLTSLQPASTQYITETSVGASYLHAGAPSPLGRRLTHSKCRYSQRAPM